MYWLAASSVVLPFLRSMGSPGLVNAEDERPPPQCLARQLQAHRTHRLHRPVRFGQEVVEGLGVRLGRLGQPWQRLALGFRDQAQFEAGELFELADIGKHRTAVRTIVVDEGNSGGWFPRLGHGAHSLQLDVVNVYPRSLYAQIDRTATVTRVVRTLAGSGGLSLPVCLVPDHGIEDGQLLMHAGHQGHLLGFARCQEAVVERLNGGITARGTERAHIERRADGPPPTPNRTATTHRPAIPI